MKINDNYKKFVIEKAIKGKYSNRKASIQLNLSIRQIQRLKKRYKEEKDILHRNKGRIPINKISKEKETEILNLYKSKYYDFNFRHFIDCLEEYEKITVSYNLVYRILNKNGLSSPKHHKKKGKENIHPLRERRKHLGELIQIDASIHNWFGNDFPKAALHGALVFSWIGDMFLILKGVKWFTIGGISFMISHIFFILSYVEFIDFSKLNIVFVIALISLFVISSSIIFKYLRPHLPKPLFYPMLLYLIINGMMNCFAWFRSICTSGGIAIITAIGALLFYISDSSLFFVRFDKNSKLKTHFLVMLTYSIGELLIVLGLVLA